VRYRITARPPASVYPPREDSELLVPYAERTGGLSVLEVGTGSGVASLAAARAGAHVVATDLNPEALRFVRDAARREGLTLDAVRTDLAAGLRRFDVVLANPPYLPTTPAQRDPDRWHNLALDGGTDGWATTARLLRDLPNHLTPNGEAYLVVSSRQHPRGRSAVLALWRDAGGERSVVGQRTIGRERLYLWRLRLRRPSAVRLPATGSLRRGPRRRRGTPDRLPGRTANRSESNPAPASGRSGARGGASGRRRSPPGS
jgi:release factor glutamine methyltransferase